MKARIIRLDKNEHSCQMAKECYDQAVLHGLSPSYFKAIDGNDAELHYKSSSVFARRKMKKGRLGVIGCFFSHYYFGQECVQNNTPFVILEHDGYMLKPLPENILDTFEDVLKLDRCDPFSNNYNNTLAEETDMPFAVEKYTNLHNKNPIKIGTGNYFKGAYAYIIKPVGAKKIIDWISENGHVPADQQIGDWIVNTQTTVPSLARLHPFYAIGSNIKQASLTRNLNK